MLPAGAVMCCCCLLLLFVLLVSLPLFYLRGTHLLSNNRARTNTAESGIYSSYPTRWLKRQGLRRHNQCSKSFLFLLMLWPILNLLLWMKDAQLEILSFIFDRKVLWILFVWNIFLAAILIFLACEKRIWDEKKRKNQM